MTQLITEAVAQTYGFSGWAFDNEAEFKHELFHRLALHVVDAIPLAQLVPGTPTCRLHSEGKVENGKPQKADLLICDPTRRQRFNYEVEYLLELKQTLSHRALTAELKKLETYTRPHLGRFLIAQRPVAFDVTALHSSASGLHVIHPGNVPPLPSRDFSVSEAGCTFSAAIEIVRGTIEEVLWLYGNGRTQYHSFFWCNYEHELWRMHSFPCEGDFNAHLYHRLRLRLPESAEIRSEVHPPGKVERVDLVVCDRLGAWCIPIDIKMNWDQFKPKYQERREKTPEAVVIMDRLAGVAARFPYSHPLVVVIQGDWRLPRDIRRTALPALRHCAYPLALVMFQEERNRVAWIDCGPCG